MISPTKLSGIFSFSILCLEKRFNQLHCATRKWSQQSICLNGFGRLSHQQILYSVSSAHFLIDSLRFQGKLFDTFDGKKCFDMDPGNV